MKEEAEGAASPTDRFATGFAMGAAAGDGASGDVQAFLREQTRLAALQSQNLIEQNAFELSHLRWRRFNDQMKGALQIMVVAVGFGVLVGFLVAVWRASQADGIVVEAFSVPPALAQSGIGSDIVASDLTNKIAAIRDLAIANSLASSKDVRRDNGNDIKVEIPDTGVSLAEVWRYLRLWFGNERPLSGNVRMLEGGRVALTVALDRRTFVYEGAIHDLDALEQKAAEQIFATFDATNYVLYLLGKNRLADAYAAAQRNAMLAPTDRERGAAYALWANMTDTALGDLALAHSRAQLSAALAPKSVAGHMDMLITSLGLGHDEDALHQALIIPNLSRKDELVSFSERGYAYAQELARFTLDQELGDFARAAADPCEIICSFASLKLRRAEYAAAMHDVAASRALLAEGLAVAPPNSPRGPRAGYFAAAAANDWAAAVRAARAYEAALMADNAQVPRLAATLVATGSTPMLAVALAHSGDFTGARRAIAATPLDCYECLRARATIAALQGDGRGAAIWFGRAVETAPSLPFAYTDWGAMLLHRGDYDGAIAKFTLANQNGPHFADPLEMWGEALMFKNRSDLALAKFQDANKCAPNWGRLHMKWGEALGYVGRKDEAGAQYRIASKLDLSTADQVALTRDMGR